MVCWVCFRKNCSFQYDTRNVIFDILDFASSCFVQGGARTTLVITAPRPSWLGLEWGFAECADGFGRHFPTFCANHCGKQTQGTTVMEWLPVLWGLHINLCSPCNHWPRWCPALIKALEDFLGCTVGCHLMVPAAKPQLCLASLPHSAAHWSQ